MSDIAIDLTRVTKAFINIRDARSALRHKFDEEDGKLREQQEKLEAVMLDHLNTHGGDAVRTEAGTFYRQEDLKPSCQDWEALNRWVSEHGAWDVYERRLKKTFIAQYMEAHDGSMPPGVSVHREYVVRVRRSN